MHVCPHLSRRGDVWYWRRKTRRFSTGSLDFHLSLRTTNRARALILARRVTAESEIIMEAVCNDHLNPREARAYLTHVIEDELARLDRYQTRAKMTKEDCFFADPEEVHWGDQLALKLVAEQGIHARVTKKIELKLIEDGVCWTSIPILEFCLQVLLYNLQSETTVASRAALFKKITGRDTLGETERLQLLQLEIEGRAAANAQPRAPAARAMAAEVLKDVSARSVWIVPETAAPAPVETLANRAEPPVVASSCEDFKLDTSILAVVNRMIEIKQADDVGLEQKTANQYLSFAALFVRATGKSDIRTVTQADVANFRTTLCKLPKSFGKTPSDKTRPLADILASAAEMPPEKVGLSTGTINRYIDHVSATVNAAKSEGIEISDKLNPSALRRKETRRARDKKRTFTVDELKKLFSHPFWSPETLKKGKLRTFDARRKSGLYWVPLICAYTGARREEISGLSSSEITNNGGVWQISVRFTEDRRIKSGASVRVLPLHDDLVELGLPEFFMSAMKRKQARVFPDLEEPASPYLGRKVGRYMANLIDQVWGEDGADLSLQSMRHYVQHTLDSDPMVTEKVSRDIMGHEGKDVHTTTYGTSSSIHVLKAAIDRLPTVIRKTCSVQK